MWRSSDINEEQDAQFFSEYIDWQKRREGEGNFFADILKEHRCIYIFDSGAGDGYDSIHLAQQGFCVTSNDIDEHLQNLLRKNALEHLVHLNITSYNWKELPNVLHHKYDGVICLGNSLTMLLNKQDHFPVLQNFHKILKPGGVMIVDHRNYDYMLENGEFILQSPQENFEFSKDYYYCNKDIDGYPIKISDELVVLEYHHKVHDVKAQLDVFPIKYWYMRDMLERLDMEVDSYGDFLYNKHGDVDFYQHVAVKK